MHKVARLFVAQWSVLLQYRFDIFLWMAVEAMTPLISLAVWYRVAAEQTSPLDQRQTLTYYLLVMLVFSMTNAWNGIFFAREVLTGDLVRALVRPVGILWRHIAENIVEKMIKLTIPLTIFISAALLFPTVFEPSIYSVTRIGLFMGSVILGMVLSFLLEMNIGFLSFWLEDVDQLRGYKILLHELTSGVIIPFAFMPLAVQYAFSFLPFRFIVSVPIELLMGQIQGAQVLYFLGIQLVWVVVLIAAMWWLWQRGIKRYAVPGQ